MILGSFESIMRLIFESATLNIFFIRIEQLSIFQMDVTGYF